MSKYDKSIDYCGPAESWLTRYIPNELFGVSINHCCYLHDMSWTGEGVRHKEGDKHFRNCIKEKFKYKAEKEGGFKGAGLRLAGFFISWLYYFSVRLGSLQHRTGGW